MCCCGSARCCSTVSDFIQVVSNIVSIARLSGALQGVKNEWFSSSVLLSMMSATRAIRWMIIWGPVCLVLTLCSIPSCLRTELVSVASAMMVLSFLCRMDRTRSVTMVLVLVSLSLLVSVLRVRVGA